MDTVGIEPRKGSIVTYRRTIVAVGVAALVGILAARASVASETPIDPQPGRVAQVDTVVVPQKPFSVDDAAKARTQPMAPKPFAAPQAPVVTPEPAAAAKTAVVPETPKPVAAKPVAKPVVVARPAPTPSVVRVAPARVEPAPVPVVSAAPDRGRKPCQGILCSTFLMLGVAY